MTHYKKPASILLLLLALTPATLAGGLPEEVSMGLMVYRDGSVSLHGSFNLTPPTPVYGSLWAGVEAAGGETSLELHGNITLVGLNKPNGISSGYFRLEVSVESTPSGSIVETRGWLSLVLKYKGGDALIDIALNLSNLASRYDSARRVLNISGELDVSGYYYTSFMKISADMIVVTLDQSLPTLLSRLNLTDAVSLTHSSKTQDGVGVLYFKADIDLDRLAEKPASNITVLTSYLAYPYSSSAHGLIEASSNGSSATLNIDLKETVRGDVNGLLNRTSSLTGLLTNTYSPLAQLPNPTTGLFNLLMEFSRAFRILDSKGNITAVFEGGVVRVEFNTPRIVGWNATSATETLKALHDFIYQAYASLPQAMGAKTPVGRTLTFRVEAEPGVVVELNGTQVSEVALDDLPNLQVSTQAQANTAMLALAVGVVAVLTGLTAFLLLWRRHRKTA
jgi:hypothetical protein